MLFVKTLTKFRSMTNGLIENLNLWLIDSLEVFCIDDWLRMRISTYMYLSGHNLCNNRAVGVFWLFLPPEFQCKQWLILCVWFCWTIKALAWNNSELILFFMLENSVDKSKICISKLCSIFFFLLDKKVPQQQNLWPELGDKKKLVNVICQIQFSVRVR